MHDGGSKLASPAIGAAGTCVDPHQKGAARSRFKQRLQVGKNSTPSLQKEDLDAHSLTNQYGGLRVRQDLVCHTTDQKHGKSAAPMR